MRQIVSPEKALRNQAPRSAGACSVVACSARRLGGAVGVLVGLCFFIAVNLSAVQRAALAQSAGVSQAVSSAGSDSAFSQDPPKNGSSASSHSSLAAGASNGASQAGCYDAGEMVRKAALEALPLEVRERLYRDAIARCPSMPEAHYNLGLLLRDRGDATLALQSFQQADSLRSDEQFGIAAGSALFSLGRHEEGRAALDRVISNHPRSVAALQALALGWESEGNRIKALETLEQARSVDSNNFATWFNLAVLYERANQLEAARAAYQRAGEIDPRHAEAQLYLGRVLSELGEAEQSRRAFERAAELAPNDSRVQMAMGALYDREGDLGRAELALKRALGVDPKNISVWVNLALVQLDASRPQSAVESAREAVSLGGATSPGRTTSLGVTVAGAADVVRAHGVLGWALLELGKADDAVGSFEMVLQLEPHSLAGLLSLAEARQRQGRSEDAQALRDRAAVDGPVAFQDLSKVASGGAPWRMWR